MSFLPENYEMPEKESGYVKIKDGETIKVRLLSDSMIWWIDWQDKKPIRTKLKPTKNVDDTKPAKEFRTFIVWDYQTSKCKILEITQATIKKSIFDLYQDSDWGDPKDYDIKISRKKEGDMTKYSVVPSNKSDPTKEMMEAYIESDIKLEVLFDGLDPFKK